MAIGFSIFLLAVGAILTFAVHATVAGIDIRVVGVILIAAGALGLVLTMVVFAPRAVAASPPRTPWTRHRPRPHLGA